MVLLLPLQKAAEGRPPPLEEGARSPLVIRDLFALRQVAGKVFPEMRDRLTVGRRQIQFVIDAEER